MGEGEGVGSHVWGSRVQDEEIQGKQLEDRDS